MSDGVSDANVHDVYPETVRIDELRALFGIGMTQEYCNASTATREAVYYALQRAFDSLEQRFGVRVLGTIDIDILAVGARSSAPWTSYILAVVPDLDAVVSVCSLVRETTLADDRLWRYITIEALLGRPLFFANA